MGGLDQREKLLCTDPNAMCHLSPHPRDREGLSATCSENKGSRDWERQKFWTGAGDGGGKEFLSLFVLSLGILFFSSMAKLVMKSLS